MSRYRYGGTGTEMIGKTVPKEVGDITPGWLTQALNAGGESTSAPVTGFSAEAIVEGKGYMSQLYRLRLSYDGPAPGRPDSVVVKLPSADPLLQKVFSGLGQNRREVSFYRELANRALIETPRCYYGDTDPATGRTVLVLEDLESAQQGDSVAGCSLDEARQCIRQLAEFQARWWNSPLLDRLPWMPLRNAETGIYQELYADAWASLLQRAGGAMPVQLRLLGDRLAEEIQRIKDCLSRPPMTIVHGDYRLDNCFFTPTGHRILLIVMDWEFCGQGRGAYDVATFVSEVFPPQDRKKAETGLLREYHSALEDRGIKDYTYEECLHDYRVSMLELFVFWIVTGGYCDYEGERAKTYLRNTLERLDAAIRDLDSTETVGLKL